MSTEANEAKSASDAAQTAAKEAPTEQQESRPGVPKRFLPGQTVCNEKNEKGKLCNGHLKEMNTQHPSKVHLRGDDALHKCQTCGALYMGPPLGHVRDTRKQQRFVERDLAAILQAAGGTLPAYDYPPGSQHAPANVRRAVKAAPTAPAADAKPAAPAGETPEQKKARLIAEHKAKLAAKQAEGQTPPAPATDKAASPTNETAQPSPAPTSGTDSSSEADRHRPAAEAQASTGQASAAPMSPAAATASPAAGAETPEDLAPEASTELTPGAPKDESQSTASEGTASQAEDK
jgi:hypothetical protein